MAPIAPPTSPMSFTPRGAAGGMVTAKWQRGGQRRSLKVEVRSEIWHIIATWLHAPSLQYLWRLRAFKETTSGHSCWPVGIHVFSSPQLSDPARTQMYQAASLFGGWHAPRHGPWMGVVTWTWECHVSSQIITRIWLGYWHLLATVLPYNVNIATALSSPLLPPQDWAGGWVSKRSWLRVNNKIPQFWINIKTHQVFVLQGSNLQ